MYIFYCRSYVNLKIHKIMTLTFIRFCALLPILLIVCSAVIEVKHENLEIDRSAEDMKVNQAKSRVKRFPNAIARGIVALEKLLRKAKFIYSNGHDRVFTKTGGYDAALKDFDKVTNPKTVRNIKRKVPEGQIWKTGRVGFWNVALEADTISGNARLKIAKPSLVPKTDRVDPKSVDTIIIIHELMKTLGGAKIALHDEF